MSGGAIVCTTEAEALQAVRDFASRKFGPIASITVRANLGDGFTSSPSSAPEWLTDAECEAISQSDAVMVALAARLGQHGTGPLAQRLLKLDVALIRAIAAELAKGE